MDRAVRRDETVPYVETVEGIMVFRHVGIGDFCQTKGEEEEEEEDCGQELKERKNGKSEPMAEG